MCGIFGQLGRIDPASALNMSRILRHRGPDDEGFVLVGEDGARPHFGPDTAVATRSAAQLRGHVTLAPTTAADDDFLLLGHRRLSIVDLSPMGHQPMPYAGRYWLTYNGEVFNHCEIRADLEARGRVFTSSSDSEVILAAYHEWGPECLHRFNGMWAFAIYDMVERSLFLSRDRFGVKPLYLWPRSDGLCFASEIKAFTAFPDWQPTPNMARVRDFLIWNVLDHTDETLFAGVTQLPAGHSLTLDLSRCLGDSSAPFILPAPVRWYDLEDQARHHEGGTAQDIRNILEDAVRLRLRADVTVGSCLSGGVDSSAIVSIMGRELEAAGSSGNLRTVTARSTDKAYDEGDYARLVAKASGATAIEVTPSPTGLFDNLDALVWHQDEPFVSTSIYAQWEVFRAAARESIVVMLDGQGADETFGGYRGFFGAALAALAKRGKLLCWLSEVRAIRANTGFSAVRSLGYTLVYLFPNAVRFWGRFDQRSYSDFDWLTADFAEGGLEDPLTRLGARSAGVKSMSVAQIRATNLPMLLRWEDRNSMAHSIEARVPFLDYRLVELAIAMPDSEKVGGGISKRVLRQALRGVVPDAILDRKDKMGFVTAEPLWMKRDSAPRFRDELLAAVGALPHVFSPAIVKQFDEVVAGRKAFDFRYWRAIVLARWANQFSVDFSQGASR